MLNDLVAQRRLRRHAAQRVGGFHGGLAHLLRVEALEDRRLMDTGLGAIAAAALDASVFQAQTNTQALGQFDGRTVVAVGRSDHSLELWSVDRNGQDPLKLFDRAPTGFARGFETSFGDEWVRVGGTLYFSWQDEGRTELWKTDGTVAGTQLVYDFSGERAFLPRRFTNVSGKLYFTVFSATEGNQLWTSDGTGQGTHEVSAAVRQADGFPDPASFDINNLVAVGGNLYFFTHGDTRQADGSVKSLARLWKTDGTAAGTAMVYDFQTMVDQRGRVSNLFAADGVLYFQASDATNAIDLWASDGTTTGTKRLTQLVASSERQQQVSLKRAGSQFVYLVEHSDGALDLWRTDGTPTGTRLVTQIESASPDGHSVWDRSSISSVGDVVYFVSSNSRVTTLWQTDGTAEGTKSILQLANHHLPPQDVPQGSLGGGPISTEGDLVITLDESLMSDGSLTITSVLFPVTNVFFPRYEYAIDTLMVVDGSLYFRAKGESGGWQVWQSDGTTAGTQPVGPWQPWQEVFDSLEIGASCGAWIDPAPNAGGESWRLAQWQRGAFNPPPTASSLELRDRVLALLQEPVVISIPIDTIPIVIGPPIGNPPVVAPTAAPSATVVDQLSDGNWNPPSRHIELLPGVQTLDHAHIIKHWQVGRFIYVVYGYDHGLGAQLWRTDGTDAGTLQLLTDYQPQRFEGPGELAEVNGQVFFTWATNGGIELWRTDGTAAGTVPVRRDWTPNANGPGSYYSPGPRGLINVNGTLYFFLVQNDGTDSLWKSDGTAAGTTQVADIRSLVLDGQESGSGLHFDPAPVTLNGKLYFKAVYSVGQGDARQTHSALLVSDGTTAGTSVIDRIVVDSKPYSGDSDLLVVNGMLFFVRSTAEGGLEVWVSDGTSEGAQRLTCADDVQLRTMAAGSEANPRQLRILVQVGNQVFFGATGADGNHQLWKTNGTTTGTQLVMMFGGSRFDLFQRSIGEFIDVNGVAYFTLSGRKTELWRSDGTVEGTHVLLTLDYSRPPHGASLNAYGVGPMPLASIRRLVNVDGKLMFLADDRIHGLELWQSNGTVAGTGLVRDFIPGQEGSYGEMLGVIDGRLILATDNPTHGPRGYWNTTGDIGAVFVSGWTDTTNQYLGRRVWSVSPGELPAQGVPVPAPYDPFADDNQPPILNYPQPPPFETPIVTIVNFPTATVVSPPTILLSNPVQTVAATDAALSRADMNWLAYRMLAEQLDEDE